MPWDAVPHEAWIDLAPPYCDAMLGYVEDIVAGYDFSETEVVISQDHFADPINNPDGIYLSINMSFRDGIDPGYDDVINLPIEFFTENTDAMISHAMYNLEGLPGFEYYEPINYSDWSVPYTREFTIQGTQVIYNGVPVGKYREPIVEAFVEALTGILAP